MCQIGDGYGGSEIKLPGSYTKQECIDKVRLQYPKANGAKMSRRWATHYFGLCYAEFGMKGWDRGIEQPLGSGQKWESCMFVLNVSDVITTTTAKPTTTERPGIEIYRL